MTGLDEVLTQEGIFCGEGALLIGDCDLPCIVTSGTADVRALDEVQYQLVNPPLQ